ncbi:MAG: phosphotransferase family protein [Nocardiopsaceae bacterium]|jgi:aminoglycoside phosphotransferase (APT) family kinase protein|nr:phosphotransferase family protein [Nocardiopsaceae bacterium]
MVQGVRVPEVSEWLAGHVSELVEPLRFDLISGGRSNLTYAVTDAAGRKIVLRRPPTSHVLSTAHDMAREFRVISALRDTDVPVAPALAFCADETVNDRPFYVMGFVNGYVLRDIAGTEAVLDVPRRRVAGEQLIDVLAAIHRVDVDAVGLGNFARRDGYIERQLRRWHGQFGKSQEQAKEIGVYRPVPLVDEVHKILTDRLPGQQGTAIVHGDYRLDNTIMSAEGRIMAVLDWELCTLGDPLADVGTLLAYWAEDGQTEDGQTEDGRAQGQAAPSAVVTMAQSAATGLPGFPTRSEIADRYATSSGRDLANIDFYIAFAYWKLACILEGVFVRYAANAMGAGASDADILGPGVEDRARRAFAALEG